MVSVMQLLLERNEFEFCATENRVSSVEHIVFFTNVRCAKSAFLDTLQIAFSQFPWTETTFAVGELRFA